MTFYKLLATCTPALAFAAMLATAGVAEAGPVNEGPPPGAILDLTGHTINHGTAIPYSVNFVATGTTTDIAFAFRDDPAFLFFSNPSVVNDTTSSTNLLLNSNFSSTYSNGGMTLPSGWNYQNQYAATFSGQVVSGGVWYDGSVQAYDSLDQDISTIVGDTYTVTFDLTENSGQSTYQDLSTNGDVTDTGGNGIDVLVYETPTAFNINSVPEPGSLGMLCVSLLGIGAAVRRHAR
ncbi:MAG: PEP-CTERM sorting domain-containing protein [Rhodopila sp.]|jgi:hypothetical protein